MGLQPRLVLLRDGRANRELSKNELRGNLQLGPRQMDRLRLSARCHSVLAKRLVNDKGRSHQQSQAPS